MFYEMKLYLQRHQLIYNLGRVHAKLKEVKKEIDRRKHLHKPTEDLTELYKELCVIFFEYYNAFSEEVEWILRNNILNVVLFWEMYKKGEHLWA